MIYYIINKMRVLCYTFTGKKLSDFIPYFFYDTINENSKIFDLVEYVTVDSEKDILKDFNTKNYKNYFNEIYVILEDKIRLNSFSRPLNEYTYCSFEDLCALLDMTSLGDLNINDMIDYYVQDGVEFKI